MVVQHMAKGISTLPLTMWNIEMSMLLSLSV